MDGDEETTITFKFTPDHVRQLAASLQFHYRYWPGYPAAPVEEQEQIKELRYIMAAALMELTFQRDN